MDDMDELLESLGASATETTSVVVSDIVFSVVSEPAAAAPEPIVVAPESVVATPEPIVVAPESVVVAPEPIVVAPVAESTMEIDMESISALAAAILNDVPTVTTWLKAPSTKQPRRVLALALDLGFRFLQTADGYIPPPAVVASADKGAAAEGEVYEQLSRAHRLRDMTRRPHCADFVCDSAAGPVLIEVKHYAGTVPGAEIDKFVRDLGERDAAAGLFVSMTSPIVGLRSRRAVSITFESRVATGALTPVVYAAPTRAGERLSADIAVAALDMAIGLAEAYPRGVRGLHGRDSMLAYAAAASQIAEGASSVRGDITGAAAALSGAISAITDRLAHLGRSARELASSQLSEVERTIVVDVSGSATIAEMRAHYPTIVAPITLLSSVVAAVEKWEASATGKWRLLKTKAAHEPTACEITFLKGRTELRVPLTSVPPSVWTNLVTTLGKKVSIADGFLGLDLEVSTEGAALALFTTK